MKPKLIVIGGGAAGFFCAVNAARLNPELSVTLLEKTSKLLTKVGVSGGGRCNVTHACFQIGDMIAKYPRGGQFLRKSFGHFFTTDTIQWFEDRGVKLKTEADGRMFPESNKSQTIIECLVREANQYGVEILMNRDVKAIHDTGNGWTLETSDKKPLKADFLCIANGGGNKIESFQWLSALGYAIVPPVPSLFTFNMPQNPITKLMGISVEKVKVKIIGTKFIEEGPLLITHWGFSGPAILKLSAWAARDLAVIHYQFKILVNWCEGDNEQVVREKMLIARKEMAGQKITNRNPFQLPQRLWEFFLQSLGIKEDLRWADLPAKLQNRLITQLTSQEFVVNGKTTFKEEFVTSGGIDLKEIDPATMQSRLHNRLFFAGEVMDVDGVTGGFNFQHAWTSGFLAAKQIAEKARNQ